MGLEIATLTVTDCKGGPHVCATQGEVMNTVWLSIEDTRRYLVAP